MNQDKMLVVWNEIIRLHKVGDTADSFRLFASCVEGEQDE